MTKPPFKLDRQWGRGNGGYPALLAKLTAEHAEYCEAESKSLEQIDLLLHLAERHGVQELVRIDCPGPLITALSRFLIVGDEAEPVGRQAFEDVFEQLTQHNLSTPEWDWDAQLRRRP